MTPRRAPTSMGSPRAVPVPWSSATLRNPRCEISAGQQVMNLPGRSPNFMGSHGDSYGIFMEISYGIFMGM